MKLFRYRKPSIKTVLGLTKITRRIRKDSGISTIERFTKPSRIKQSIKQKVGIYSPTMTVIRQTTKGKLPSLLGLSPNSAKDGTQTSISQTNEPSKVIYSKKRKLGMGILGLFILLMIIAGITAKSDTKSAAVLPTQAIKEVVKSPLEVTPFPTDTSIPSPTDTPIPVYIQPTATPIPVFIPTTNTNTSVQQPQVQACSGATALCGDGSCSYAAHHQGACSRHGGVNTFYN